MWGSAFSILFNRVLGVKDTVGGSTMEEELGNLFMFLLLCFFFSTVLVLYESNSTVYTEILQQAISIVKYVCKVT